MLRLPVLHHACVVFAAIGLCVAAPTLAQERAAPLSAEAFKPAPADMAAPDDLGAPLTDATEPAGADKAAGKTLSVDMPIAVIAANPQGRAVLDKDLPGLCKRPEYSMFKGLTLTRLAGLSHGRIKPKTLDHVQADLIQVSLTGETPRSANPLTAGGRTISRFSRALYQRVAMVIAAL